MPLATKDDVKRVLGIESGDNSWDDVIDPALEAVIDWASSAIGFDEAASGVGTETFFNVRNDARLVLREAGDVLTVEDENGVALDHYVIGNGAIRMGQPLSGYRLTAFRGLPYQYGTVVVTYDRDETVGPAIRDAIALIAAEYVPLRPVVNSDGTTGLLKSEKIGDYSYTIDTATLRQGTTDKIRKAMRLLRPFIRRQRVRVTS